MSEGFQARNLTVIAYGNGHTQWHFITPDAAQDVESDGYFEDANDTLRVGDILTINTERDSGEMKTLVRCVSSSGSRGVSVEKPG